MDIEFPTAPAVVPPIVRADELRRGASRTRTFVGAEHGAGVSYFFVDNEPGQGPDIHRHPYPETWVLLEGEARITIDDDGAARRRRRHGHGPCGRLARLQEQRDRPAARAVHPRVGPHHPGVAGRSWRARHPHRQLRRTDMTFQAYLDNIEAKTGLTPAPVRRTRAREGLRREHEGHADRRVARRRLRPRPRARDGARPRHHQGPADQRQARRHRHRPLRPVEHPLARRQGDEPEPLVGGVWGALCPSGRTPRARMRATRPTPNWTRPPATRARAAATTGDDGGLRHPSSPAPAPRCAPLRRSRHAVTSASTSRVGVTTGGPPSSCRRASTTRRLKSSSASRTSASRRSASRRASSSAFSTRSRSAGGPRPVSCSLSILRRIHQSGSWLSPRPGMGLPAPGRSSNSPRRIACWIAFSTTAARSAAEKPRAGGAACSRHPLRPMTSPAHAATSRSGSVRRLRAAPRS